MNSQNVNVGYTKPSVNYDTNYIQTYPEHITARLYMSRKFTDISFIEQEEGLTIDYKPNTTLNLGIGATIKGFTLNLAYGFRFLNEDQSKGKTRYLDLQSHMYGRKHVIDFFGQFYTGMYLENTSFLIPNYEEPYYLRPDIGIVLIGLSYFRVFNDQKFSYSASLVQNEWQKKSAGSFLLGAKALVIGAISDTSMIPSFLGDTAFKSFENVDRLSTIQIGPGVGYAHTFVMWHHYFITLSLDMNLMLSSIRYRQQDIGTTEDLQMNATFDVRIAMGYNSNNSYFGLSFVEDENQIKTADRKVFAQFGVGNVRLNYAKRFRMGPKLKDKVDKYLP